MAGKFDMLPDETYKKNSNNIKWFATTINACELLATSGLSGNQVRILFTLLNNIDKHNCFYVVQKELAEKIGSKKESVSRAIKAFKDLDIIKKAGVKLYMVNPIYFYQGGRDTIYHLTELYNNLDKKK